MTDATKAAPEMPVVAAETKQTCCARIHVGGWAGRGHACGRGAKFEHNGRWFCKTHHPPTAKAKSDERQRAWYESFNKRHDEARAAADALTAKLALADDALSRISALTRERDEARAEVEALRTACLHARQFIRNGIDLGFIRMPDADTPDTAHDTLPIIDAALARSSAKDST